MEIQWINDIDLINETEKYEVILIGTNVYCTLGNGFQHKIKKKYPHVDEVNMRMSYGDSRRLGTRLNVECNDITFSLCYITGYPFYNNPPKKEYLDYGALENCLKTADIEFEGKKVATTLIGTSRFDGNADRGKVIELLNSSIKRMDLTIYDYFQMTRDEENKKQWEEIQKYKKIDYNKYKELAFERKKNWKSLYL